jgi:hypothetical protein
MNRFARREEVWGKVYRRKEAQVFLRRVPMWSVPFLEDVIMILAGQFEYHGGFN